MKILRKTLSVILCSSLLCAALGIGASAVTETSGLPVLEGNYTSCTDFSLLTPSDTAYLDAWQEDASRHGLCELDTSSEIFTEGILRDTGNFAVGESNFHGFYVPDNGNGGAAYIEARAYDDKGMRFTIGLNGGSAPADSSAVAVHINNENIPEEWTGALQSWDISLIDKNGTAYGMKPYNTAGDGMLTYFLNTADGSVTKRAYNQYATGVVMGRVDGWIVFPLDLFENAAAADEIVSVSFNISSYWGVNSRIYEIGFVSDLDGFLGIAPPLSDSEYMTMATDFSMLAPSRTEYIDAEYGYNCTLDTDSDLFGLGIMTEDVSEIGIGLTNFHGFYATDTDGDGGTDFLEAYPYNDGGMRFTLGMTEEPDVTGEAIAIHLESNFPPESSEWVQGLSLTVNDKNGAHAYRAASSVSSDLKYYFVNAQTGEHTAYSYAAEGWVKLSPLYPEGWLIIPVEMFEGDIDTAEINSVKFDFTSSWNMNTRIYGVGYVTDMYALLGLERPLEPIGKSEYLKQANDLSMLPVTRELFIDGYQTENPNWDCILNTNTELFTSGVMVEKEQIGVIETGTGVTNFHGFYTADTDGDGKTDTLEAYPRDNRGMNFTLGLNGASDFSGGEAIAIHFSNSGTGAWNDSVYIDCKITLNDADGNEYEMQYGKDYGSCAYFYDDEDRSITVRNMDADAHNSYILRACRSGWLVVPIACFGDLDTADIASVSFSLASIWEYNIRISEISAVTDMNAFLGRTYGDINWDDEITAEDLAIVKQVLLGYHTEIDEYLCDINEDKSINIRDLVCFKKSLAS